VLLSSGSPAFRNIRTCPVFAPPDSFLDGFIDERVVQPFHSAFIRILFDLRAPFYKLVTLIEFTPL
jgi:hypothetical protein